MDASQYKDYVLVLLFVKYVSDKYAGNPNALIDVPAGGSLACVVQQLAKLFTGPGFSHRRSHQGQLASGVEG